MAKKIYVSSTKRDLIEYRAKVIEAIHQLHQEPIESYTATSIKPLEKCLDDVSQCDLYIGIFALRYGYIPDGESLSMTELEYRKAKELCIPRLIFLLDYGYPWKPNDIEWERIDKIKVLRDELDKDYVCAFFQGEDHLKEKVYEALSIELKRQSQLGAWNQYVRQLAKLEVVVPLPFNVQNNFLNLNDCFVFPTLEPSQNIAYRFPINTILGRERKQLILGELGSGKSTLLQYLLLSLCDPTAINYTFPNFVKGTIPILIQLSSYTRHRQGEVPLPSLLEYTIQLIKEKYDLLIDKKDVEILLDSGKALFLFDGLDEIFDSKVRHKCIEEINDLGESYKKISIVVTSRPISGIRLTNYSRYQLLEFNQSQIKAFIIKWYKTQPTHLGKTTVENHINNLVKNPHILDLARVPLFLVALMILSEREELPTKLWLLVSRISELLLTEWEEQNKSIKAQAFFESELLSSQNAKKKLLQKIARHILENVHELDSPIIERSILIGLVIEFSISYLEYSRAKAVQHSEEIINYFQTRSNIIRETKNDVYEFNHRIFIDYYIAIDIGDQISEHQYNMEWLKAEVFDKYFDEVPWRNALRLVISLMDERSSYINDLLDHIVKNHNNLYPQNIIFVAYCMIDTEFSGKNLLESIILELTKIIRSYSGYAINDVNVLYQGQPVTTEFFDSSSYKQLLALAIHAFIKLGSLIDIPQPAQLIIDELKENANHEIRSIAFQMECSNTVNKSEYILDSLDDSENTARLIGVIRYLNHTKENVDLNLQRRFINYLMVTSDTNVIQQIINLLSFNTDALESLLDALHGIEIEKISSDFAEFLISEFFERGITNIAEVQLLLSFCNYSEVRDSHYEYKYKNVHNSFVNWAIGSPFDDELFEELLNKFNIFENSFSRVVLLRSFVGIYGHTDKVREIVLNAAANDESSIVRYFALLLLADFDVSDAITYWHLFESDFEEAKYWIFYYMPRKVKEVSVPDQSGLIDILIKTATLSSSPSTIPLRNAAIQVLSRSGNIGDQKLLRTIILSSTEEQIPAVRMVALLSVLGLRIDLTRNRQVYRLVPYYSWKLDTDNYFPNDLGSRLVNQLLYDKDIEVRCIAIQIYFSYLASPNDIIDKMRQVSYGNFDPGVITTLIISMIQWLKTSNLIEQNAEFLEYFFKWANDHENLAIRHLIRLIFISTIQGEIWKNIREKSPRSFDLQDQVSKVAWKWCSQGYLFDNFRMLTDIDEATNYYSKLPIGGLLETGGSAAKYGEELSLASFQIMATLWYQNNRNADLREYLVNVVAQNKHLETNPSIIEMSNLYGIHRGVPIETSY